MREGLGGFVLRTFLWLPVCLAAWYFTAPIHGIIAGSMSSIYVNAFDSKLVRTVEREGLNVVFVTGIEVQEAGKTGVLVPDVNPLIYTYGLAFFAALMLASRARLWALALGAIALLPFQAWGIAFDFLAQLVRAGPEIAGQAGLTGGKREVIALCYQLGSLIFPPVVPVMLWAFFNRDFIDRSRGARPGGAAS